MLLLLNNSLFWWGTQMRLFCLCCIYICLGTGCVCIYCTLFYFFIPNTFFPLLCVNTSRCSTGSATTKNCSCRVTQRLAWATNMPSTSRHSTTTLPWIPWWVEGALGTVGLCAWVRKVTGATCERWRKEGQAGLGSSSLSGKQNVTVSTQTLIDNYFLDLRAARSCGVFLHFR